jgi:hypothetical protein
VKLLFSCLVFLLLFIDTVLSQQKDQSDIKILFQGRLFDSETYKPLPGSQLFINQKFTSVTDDDGSFAVYVNVNDSLVFRRAGYKPEKMVVSDTLVGKQYVAGIFMTTDTLDIGEVIIVPRMISLRSRLFNTRSVPSAEMENARQNIAISAYQGRVSTGKLGDPTSNYELLRQNQKINAFEKGGIPSDKIVGFSPFMLLSAAYLLINGLPEKTSKSPQMGGL